MIAAMTARGMPLRFLLAGLVALAGGHARAAAPVPIRAAKPGGTKPGKE